MARSPTSAHLGLFNLVSVFERIGGPWLPMAWCKTRGESVNNYGEACVEAWTAVAEHRARKELLKVVPIRSAGGIRPKNAAEKFSEN